MAMNDMRLPNLNNVEEATEAIPETATHAAGAVASTATDIARDFLDSHVRANNRRRNLLDYLSSPSVMPTGNGNPNRAMESQRDDGFYDYTTSPRPSWSIEKWIKPLSTELISAQVVNDVQIHLQEKTARSFIDYVNYSSNVNLTLTDETETSRGIEFNTAFKGDADGMRSLRASVGIAWDSYITNTLMGNSISTTYNNQAVRRSFYIQTAPPSPGKTNAKLIIVPTLVANVVIEPNAGIDGKFIVNAIRKYENYGHYAKQKGVITVATYFNPLFKHTDSSSHSYLFSLPLSREFNRTLTIVSDVRRLDQNFFDELRTSIHINLNDEVRPIYVSMEGHPNTQQARPNIIPRDQLLSNEAEGRMEKIPFIQSTLKDEVAKQKCDNALLSAAFLASTEYDATTGEDKSSFGAGLGTDLSELGVPVTNTSSLSYSASTDMEEQKLLNDGFMRVVTAPPPLYDDTDEEQTPALVANRREIYMAGPGGSYVRVGNRTTEFAGAIVQNKAKMQMGTGTVANNDLENPVRNTLPASNVFTPILPYIANVLYWIDLGLNLYNLINFIKSTIIYFVNAAQPYDQGEANINMDLITYCRPSDQQTGEDTVDLENETYEQKIERIYGKTCCIRTTKVTQTRKEFEIKYPSSVTRCNTMGWGDFKEVRDRQFDAYVARLRRDKARQAATSSFSNDLVSRIQDTDDGAIIDFSKKNLVSCHLTESDKEGLKKLYEENTDKISTRLSITDDLLRTVLGSNTVPCRQEARDYVLGLSSTCGINDDKLHQIARMMASGKTAEEITADALDLPDTCQEVVDDKVKEINSKFRDMSDATEATNVWS